NAQNGIMFDEFSNDNTAQNNIVTNNGINGLTVYQSERDTFKNNTSEHNANGARIGGYALNNTLSNNEFAFNQFFGVVLTQGNDPRNVNSGIPSLNIVDGNQIHDNSGFGVRLLVANNNSLTNNTIANNNTGQSDKVSLEDTVGNLISGNTSSSGLIVYT